MHFHYKESKSKKKKILLSSFVRVGGGGFEKVIFCKKESKSKIKDFF